MIAAVLALLAGAIALAPVSQRASRRLDAVRRDGRLPALDVAFPEIGRAGRGRGAAARAPRALLGALRLRGSSAAHGPDLRVAVRALAEDLDAGAAPDDAWERAAELAGSAGAAFQAAALAIRAGRPVDGALGSATDPQLRRLAAAWACSAEAGAASAEVLRRWVEDADARERARRAQSVELAGPRSSALLLAGLPALGVLLGIAMGADPIGTITGSLAGAALAVIGIAFDVGGLLWMRRIIGVAARQ